MAPMHNSNIRVPGATKDVRGVWRCDDHEVPIRERNDGTYICRIDGRVFEFIEEPPDAPVKWLERLRSRMRRS